MQPNSASSAIRVIRGVPADQRRRAVEIYHTAFEQKLSSLLGNRETAISILETSMSVENAFVALQDGLNLGLVGFQHEGHKLIDVTLPTLT
jgi:hypothetical protein